MAQQFPSKLSVLDPVRAVQAAVRRWQRRSELSNPTPANETPQIIVDPALETPNPQELPTATGSSQPSILSTGPDVSTPSTSAYESPACTQLNLDRLYPDHGPMHGGEEILIVGKGFEAEQRLTIHFGPNPPVKAVFKAPNNLSCILPPSTTAGPTRVTLHWSQGIKDRASADHCEFTYIDQLDQKICELTLQLHGLLEYRELQAPVEVAKRMIKSTGGPIPGSVPTRTSPAHQPVLTILQALLDGDPSPDIESGITLLRSSTANAHSREESLISILSSHPQPPKDTTAFNLVNEYRQNLAHLCAQLGYHRLLTFVIERGVDISAKDANGWMPLDFARFYGDLNAVDILEGEWECDVKVPERGPLRLEPKNLISSSLVPSPGVAQTAQLVEPPTEHEPTRSNALFPSFSPLPQSPRTAELLRLNALFPSFSPLPQSPRTAQPPQSNALHSWSYLLPQSPRTGTARLDDVSGLDGLPSVDLTSPPFFYFGGGGFAGDDFPRPGLVGYDNRLELRSPEPPAVLSSQVSAAVSATVPAAVPTAVPAAMPDPVSATTARLSLKKRGRSKEDGEQSTPKRSKRSAPKGGKHTARSPTKGGQLLPPSSVVESSTSREDIPTSHELEHGDPPDDTRTSKRRAHTVAARRILKQATMDHDQDDD